MHPSNLINRVILILLVILFCKPLLSDEPSQSPTHRMAQIIELYKQGPSQSDTMIRLLKEELAEHPDSETAHSYLGIIYYGTEHFKEAIDQFDWVIDHGMKEKNHLVVHSGLMLKRIHAYALIGQTRYALNEIKKWWALINENENYSETEGSVQLLHAMYLSQDSMSALGHRENITFLNKLFVPLSADDRSTLGNDSDLRVVYDHVNAAGANDCLLILTNDGKDQWLVYFSDNLPVSYLHAVMMEDKKLSVGALIPLPRSTSSKPDISNWVRGNLTTDQGIKVMTLNYSPTKPAEAGSTPNK